jgi:tetratricopeptide (TPR) repeat protein
MNLKLLFLTLTLATITNFSAFGQESTYNEGDCAKYRSLYYQYLKQDMIRDACTFWGMAATNCGDSLDGKFYKNGRVAFLKLLKTVDDADEARKKEINDSIMWIYEQRMGIEKDSDWELDYAVMLVSKKSEDFEKLDKLFENIHILKHESSGTQIRMYFRHLIINRFNKSEGEQKEAYRVRIIEEYIVLSDYCKAALKSAEGIADDKKKAKKIKSYNSAQQFLDKYFLKIAKDCAVLTPVLEKKFTSIPEGEAGMAELNKFIGLMEKQKCTDTETYEKFVIEANARNPTAAGFFGLGNIYKNKSQKSKAVEAFTKALEMEGEGENKMTYTLELAKAQYKAGQYKSAYRTAKSIDGDLKGKALVICGNSIAALSNSCGESTFDRNANYWLANDYYRKAASAGEGVSSSKFLDRAPDANAVFDAGHSMGGSFTLSCWGESTIIR